MKTNVNLVTMLMFLLASAAYASQNESQPSVPAILNANHGVLNGHDKSDPKLVCVIAVYLPGEHIPDGNIWVQVNQKDSVSSMAYPGIGGWTIDGSRMTYYFDNSMSWFVSLQYNPETLKFTESEYFDKVSRSECLY